MLVPKINQTRAVWCWLADPLGLPMEKAEFHLLLLSLRAWVQVTFFYKAASFHEICRTILNCEILYVL